MDYYQSSSVAKPPKGYLYKRVLLKLSGEALLGERSFGIDPKEVEHLAKSIKKIYDAGVEIGIVVGGGNIFRGMAGSQNGMDRAQADYMGMLATVMNGLALQDGFEQNGLTTRVMTSVQMQQVAEVYIRRRAIRHLEKGRIDIFAGGTGNPYFTTDSAAALRALEIDAQCIIKATKVNGVFDKDPAQHGDAQRYELISHKDVLAKDLRVMDAAATALCRDNNLPILVLDINEENVFEKALKGKHVGTLVTPDDVQPKMYSVPKQEKICPK